MRIARQTCYVRQGMAAWLLFCFVVVSWIPSSSYALPDTARAKKPASGKTVAKQPHERVEEIAQTLEYEQLRQPKSPPRTYSMSEGEINSYIVYKMKQQPVKGMKSLVLNLQDANHLTATALVDFDQVKLRNEGMMGSLFKKIMTGDHYLKMDGTLASGQHKGQFVVTRAELGGVVIPNSLVLAIIRHVGEKQHPPVDLTKPFELPYGIERVEISTGAVRVKT